MYYMPSRKDNIKEMAKLAEDLVKKETANV